MKGRLVSPNEFNDWDTEIGNFGFGYTDFATGINKKSKKILFWQKLNWDTLSFLFLRTGIIIVTTYIFLYCTVLII